MHKAIFCWIAAIVVTMAVASPAAAERRVALVVGNSNYVNVVRLPNPRNDAGDVGVNLKTLGFDVTTGLDLDRSGLLNALMASGAPRKAPTSHCSSTPATACR